MSDPERSAKIMKLFITIFLAVALAGAGFIAYQQNEKKQQNAHERKVELALSMAHSNLGIMNSLTGNLNINPSDKQVIERRNKQIEVLKESVEPLRRLAEDPRTSAKDAQKLNRYISEFQYEE